MKRKIIILLLVIFPAGVIAQETLKTTTIAFRGVTNFTAVAKYELTHPPKIQPMPPEEEEEDIDIRNAVDINVLPFSGTSSTISSQPRRVERVEEAPCINFRGLDDNNGPSPPDVNGTVGFDHVMVTLNTQLLIQNKQGGTISTVSLSGFWNGIAGHTDFYDPKITYDPYNKRWVFVSCADRQSASSALLVAVSQTYDPTGSWNMYSIDADAPNLFWFDYPSLGFNRNWITVGGFMFNIPGLTNTQRSRVWVINKSDVYAGLTTVVTSFDRTDYFHISPAVTYDANDNTNWCVSVHNNNSDGNGYVKLFSITGTAAAPVFNVGSTVNVGIAWTANGVNGPQFGSATGLDLGDDRILQSTFRNGILWLGNNVFLPAASPTTCAAQIVSINPSTGLATENIKTSVDNTGASMNAYPSVTVNQNNDVFFGYSNFNSTAYVQTAISFRRAGQGFFSYSYKAGEDWFVKTDPAGKNRWGDYTATFIDPEDDMTAWTVTEYARPRVAGTSFWGTWWAKVCPGSCTNDFVLSAFETDKMRKYEANNTITSTEIISGGSFIKYDAGTRIILSPGFHVLEGSRLQVYVEGCGGAR